MTGTSPSGHIAIAIDGPSGSGKSTVSRALAADLAGDYVDTGATYRALTWGLLQRGVHLESADAIAAACAFPEIQVSSDPGHQQVFADSVDVTEAIRSEEVTAAVSAVAAVPAVRARLVSLQRTFAERARAAGRPVVMEGRDIGTVVLPEATLKVWLTADVQARAARRAAEVGAHHAHTIEALEVRDAKDSSRAISPAEAAPDAVVIDATHLDVAGVVAAIRTALNQALQR